MFLLTKVKLSFFILFLYCSTWGMNWATLPSYSENLFYLQPCLLSNLHFFLILDSLIWLRKVRDKLLKQLLPSKLGMPSTPTKRGLSAGSIVTLPQLWDDRVSHGTSRNKWSVCRRWINQIFVNHHLAILEEEMVTLQYSCWEILMDRGAWQATVCGAVQRVGHDWACTHTHNRAIPQFFFSSQWDEIELLPVLHWMLTKPPESSLLPKGPP